MRKVKGLSVVKRAAALLMAFVCSVTVFAAGTVFHADAAQYAGGDYGLADNIQDGTILHCFCWKYSDIKDELENIAKAGFTSVQTSPVQATGLEEEYLHDPVTWYMLYQPSGFTVASNGFLGTKQELKELCEEADKYGIKVLTDVVANHLTGNDTRIEDDLRADEFWRKTKAINYNNRKSITTGQLLGLPELNTENEYVQSRVMGLLNELKELGVDGIRWDAAKHIALPSEGSDFWEKMTNTGMYNYGEILGGPGGSGDTMNSLMQEYTEYMSVTDSGYGDDLRNAFSSGKTLSLQGRWTNRGVAADKLLYWGESHDTYADSIDTDANVQKTDQNVIDRAYAIAAAREGATSLYFSRPYGTDRELMLIGEKGSTHFKSAEVSAVNHFHNAMIGKPDSYYSDGKCCVVSRKDGGAVIALGSGSGEVSIKNAGGYVPAGTYTDEISGNTFTVTADKISGITGESGIAVIYAQSKPSKIWADLESGSWRGGNYVALNAVAVNNPRYVLTKTDSNGNKTVTEKAFKNGDYVGIGIDDEKTMDWDSRYYYTLELFAESQSGEKLKETYNYEIYGYYYQATEPEQSKVSLCIDSTSYSWLFDYEAINRKIYCHAYKNGDLNSQPEIIEMNYDRDNYRFLVCKLPESLKDSDYIQLYFVNDKGEAIKSGDNSSFKMKYTDFGMYRMHIWAAINMHEHDCATDFKSDSESHWHECRGCSEKIDLEKHISSDWIIDRQATKDSEGSAHKECTVCKRILETKVIEKLSSKEEAATEQPTSATESTKSTLSSTKTDNSVSSNKKAVQTGGGYFALFIVVTMLFGIVLICFLRVKQRGK